MVLTQYGVSYALLHTSNFLLVDSSIPNRTSSWIINSVLSDMFNPLCEFIHGAIGVRLSDHKVWVETYQLDQENELPLSFIKDPSLVTTESILKVYYLLVFCLSVRNDHIYAENGILFFQELFSNDDQCMKVTKSPWLCIVSYYQAWCW